MATTGTSSELPGKGFEKTRRAFLKNGIIVGAFAGISGAGLISSCKEKDEGDVTPSEDLMREHGALNRVLLIYDSLRSSLQQNESFDPVILKNSAGIIRSFIEDYHEKLEEDFLFPRFEKANQLTDLVQVLRAQHKAGRILTEQIMVFGNMKSVDSADDKGKLVKLLSDFNRMYRPHEAREDTILFPAIKKVVSRNEYFSLGEDFEDKEHKLFGEDGFESMVEKIAGIEKQLGIYELSQFTPQL